MMMDVSDFLTILLYIFGCTLLVSLTVFTIKLMGTLKKVDSLLDDLSTKSEQLNGVFDIVDRSSGVVNSVVNGVSEKVSGVVSHIIKKKKGMDEDE